MHIGYGLMADVVLVNKKTLLKFYNMKTIFCLSGLILLMNYSYAQSEHAQKPAPSFTISAGISSAAYMSDDEYGKSYTSDFKTGFCGGVTLRLHTGVHWAVEPGLFYVQKGGKENV